MSHLHTYFTDKCYRISYYPKVLKDENNEKEIVFGYIRVSKKRNQKNTSISQQIKMIENSTLFKGQILSYIYVDEAVSGKDLERPSFGEMMKEIKKHVVTQHKLLNIMTCYLHRLTRSTDSISEITKILVKLNISLTSLDIGKIDLQNESTKMMLLLLTSNNQNMRLSTIQNTKNIMRSLSNESNLILKHRYGWIRVPKPGTDKSMEIVNPREIMVISEIIKLWNDSDRKIKYTELAIQLNEDPDLYYKEDDKLWTYHRIESIIYKQILSERVISGNPVEMKDELCKEAIIKMIKTENLKTKSPFFIGKLLDAKCLYKHRITKNYVSELLEQIGDKYINKIDENIEKYIEEIKEVIKELRVNKMSFNKMSNYLNEKGYLNPKGKEWSLSKLNYFCRMNHVLS
jgi:DNA invertase Pin-like site-specific DNA recombinase